MYYALARFVIIHETTSGNVAFICTAAVVLASTKEEKG